MRIAEAADKLTFKTYKDVLKNFEKIENDVLKIANDAVGREGLINPATDKLKPAKKYTSAFVVMPESKKIGRIGLVYTFNTLLSSETRDAMKYIERELREYGVTSPIATMSQKQVGINFNVKLEEPASVKEHGDLNLSREDIANKLYFESAQSLYNEKLKNGILNGDRRAIEEAIKEIGEKYL